MYSRRVVSKFDFRFNHGAFDSSEREVGDFPAMVGRNLYGQQQIEFNYRLWWFEMVRSDRFSRGKG
jgi:hypothetical protein